MTYKVKHGSVKHVDEQGDVYYEVGDTLPADLLEEEQLQEMLDQGLIEEFDEPKQVQASQDPEKTPEGQKTPEGGNS